MRYGASPDGDFVLWLDSTAAYLKLRLSANEAEHLYDALIIWRADRVAAAAPVETMPMGETQWIVDTPAATI